MGLAPAARGQGRGAPLHEEDLGESMAPMSPRSRSTHELNAADEIASVDDAAKGDADNSVRPTRKRRRRADFDGVAWDQCAPDVDPRALSEVSSSFRLSVDFTLLGYDSATTTPRGSPIGIDRSVLTYGLTQNAGVGVTLGYGLSERFVLSARIVLSNTTIEIGRAGGVSQLRLQFTPSLEYLFNESADRVRPFVAFAPGLLVGDVPLGTVSVTEVSFVLAGQVGLHAFPVAHASIDPTLLVGYRVGGASGDAGGAFTISGLIVLLGLGVSFWS